MAGIGNTIEKAADLLKSGALVAIPTETVYGLAANALNEKAVLSVFETKKRPAFDPLILHFASLSDVEKYAFWEDEKLLRLAKIFWPGPLTLLLKRKALVPDLVCSGLPQVAVRVPNHPLTLHLLQQLDFPLAAPSANPFGYISPTTAEHVNRQLGTKIPYILDGGACGVGLESTIVGTENNEVVVYRLGGLTVEDLEKHIGPVHVKLNQSSNPVAPGQLKSHYAPRKPLVLGNLEDTLKEYSGKRIAVITFGTKTLTEPYTHLFNLSVSGNMSEAALHLFRLMREADDSDAEMIAADYVPEHSFGKAINDRLQRAANH
jgi:L-threonylcarbamoyladenylate synthase